ncbi:MAG: putative drug exporter of the superfamily [Frankiaceae bacterium]|nr:putative drug exporter of the superfamily [Frankiaceae bacterium]
MKKIAEFVLRHRRWVLVGWLLVLVAGVALTQKTNSRLVIDFSLPGQPGTQTANQIDADFHAGGKTAPYILTVTMPAGQTVTGNETQVGQTFAAVQQNVPQTRVVDEANTGDKAFRTKDDRTAYALMFYRFNHDPTAPLQTNNIRAALTKAAPPGAAVGVTGEDALAVGDSSGGNGVLAEVGLGAIGALAVLAFVFASFLALLPMVVAAVSILTTFILLLPLTYLTDVSFIVEFLVALIGLGVAIDYSLIFVTRWREERDHGRDNHDAVVIAMETAGKAVVFSGITVAIGLLALVVLPVPFMRSIGLGGALIPLASVLTTLTLTPAILGGIGPRVDWPKIRHENKASRSWSRWARTVVQHRLVAAGVAALSLGLLFVSFLGIKIGLASSSSLARNGHAYEALQTLQHGGVSTGLLTPMEVLVKTPDAQAVAARIDSVDGVDRAVVATGAGQTANGESIVVVIPDEETVNSSSVGPVRRVKSATQGMSGVIGVAGIGADQIDFLKAVYGNFPLMLTIIALLTFVLLARAFRSIVLPLKAILLNLITLAATLGFMVLFWQYGHGAQAIFGVHATGAVTFWIPLMVFAFLFGLSMDYEVFILARIREEYSRSGSTDEAVVEGIGRTGRLVTSAALILFLAFIALASGPGTDLKTFASALGFGILLDATIVRSMLVPALVSLFGGWNWWMPGWAARILRVDPQPVTAIASASG